MDIRVKFDLMLLLVNTIAKCTHFFIVLLLLHQIGGAINAFGAEVVINKCLFLNNVAEATGNQGEIAKGGAISFAASDGQVGSLDVVNSIFKKNKAIQVVSLRPEGGGGAINVRSSSFGTATQVDVLVLSSVFESNEATYDGGAVQFLSFGSAGELSVEWFNNKELLFGNAAGADGACDGAEVEEDCFSVGDNFSSDFPQGVQMRFKVDSECRQVRGVRLIFVKIDIMDKFYLEKREQNSIPYFCLGSTMLFVKLV